MRNWIKMLLYLSGLLLIQEIGFRFLFPLPELKNFDRSNYMTTGSSTGRHRYLRDSNWYWPSYPDTTHHFIHEMNRYGFRDKEWHIKKDSGKPRILFVGDSFVEGVMAEQHETISEGFRLAAEPGQYEILNGGMMGVGLETYLQFLSDVIPVFRPDVILLILYANDVPRKEIDLLVHSFSPEYYLTLKPRLFELVHQVIRGNPVPIRWKTHARSFLPAVPSGANPWTQSAIKFTPHVHPELADAMRRGRYNFFKMNQILREEIYLKKTFDFSKAIHFLHEICFKNDAELMIFYLPARHQVTQYYYQYERMACRIDCPPVLDMTGPSYQVHRQALAVQCTASQIPFFDLTEPVREAEKNGRHLYWNYDDHMRGEGYMLIGRCLYTQWQARKDCVVNTAHIGELD